MSAKPDTPPRGKCPRKCEVSAGPIAVAKQAEVQAADYGAAKSLDILRGSRGRNITDLIWLEAILAGAFEDGYKRGAAA